MDTINIDTRSYNRRQFADQLVDILGPDSSGTTTAEAVEYINQNVQIVDFDGAKMDAGRWSDDLVKILGN